jgi:hypothetical protein
VPSATRVRGECASQLSFEDPLPSAWTVPVRRDVSLTESLPHAAQPQVAAGAMQRLDVGESTTTMNLSRTERGFARRRRGLPAVILKGQPVQVSRRLVAS